jgi:hypothetical protein
MTLDVTNGKFEVRYCTKHTVHGEEEGRNSLTISSTLKNLILEQVKQGVSAKRILRSIRNDAGFGSEGLLLSRDDINNIIDKTIDYKLHADDAESVRCFVEREQDENKTVFLYKAVGVDDQSFPGMNASDFLLGFMTNQQEQILLEAMKGPEQILCIDSTHKTNAYDFYLTTLLTVTSLGKGIPVAFLFTTKEETTALSYFFEGIKQRVGNLHPKVKFKHDLFYTKY